MGITRAYPNAPITAAIVRLLADWKSWAECLFGPAARAEEYVSVPFGVVKKVRVTYRQVGDLKPVPYPLDEET
jgi:hypothetical protein